MGKTCFLEEENFSTLRICGFPIPGSVQDQSGWGFQQLLYWKVYLPVARGLELGDL